MLFSKRVINAPSIASDKRAKGAHYESLAHSYLNQHGLLFIQRNFNCKVGEIDLIMQDRSCLVFIEVRYRKHTQYGSAVESISQAKMRKVMKAAQYWLMTKHLSIENTEFRFDVVAIDSDDRISWIKNAMTQG
ncbi:YraN family protein [Vibrio sp.]|nr:YraN family protein [Vibrio sp.]